MFTPYLLHSAVIFTCTGKPYHNFCKAVSTFPEGTYLIQVRLFIYFGLPLAAQNLKGVVSQGLHFILPRDYHDRGNELHHRFDVVADESTVSYTAGDQDRIDITVQDSRHTAHLFAEL